MKKLIMVMFALVCMGTQVNAQITVDGTLDAAGYSLVATQTNNTGFGDAAAPDFFGSELDAMYVGVEGTRVYVLLTGNLEGNFNKLEVFIDSLDGGENSLSSTPQYDFLIAEGPDWQSQLLGGLVSGGPGMTFDTDFDTDYHMFFRRGFAGDNGNVFDVDFINRMGGGLSMVPGNSASEPFDFGAQTAAGSIDVGELGLNSAGDAIANSIEIAINNSNELGVIGDTSIVADSMTAEAVTTGIEFSIDVADLGLDPAEAGTIKIVAMINGGSHDFLSNQVLPGLPSPMNNLGGDNNGNFIGDCGSIDFSALAGDQFYCIEYSPSGGLVGDINCDGVINLLDVAPFVDLLTNGGFSTKADINGDGAVNLLDVAPFVALLSGN